MRISIVFLIVVFVIALMLCSCVGSYVPYSEDKMFSIQYPYESFADKKDAKKDAKPDAKKEEGFAGIQSTIDTIVAKIGGEEGDKKKCSKVEGFGLMPAPYGSEAPLDRFSALKSSKTCEGSPYSTSSGYLCLDKETEKLLKTRGGNISGGDSQIGK